MQLETSSVAILMNDVEETVVTQIAQIAKSVRSLKIVTCHLNKFAYLNVN